MAPDCTQVLVCAGLSAHTKASCMASQHRPLTQVCHGLQGGMGGALDASYRALSRARHEAASKKTRTMQVIEDPLQALRNPGPRSIPQKPKVGALFTSAQSPDVGFAAWGVTIRPGAAWSWGGRSSPASSPAGTARRGRLLASVL